MQEPKIVELNLDPLFECNSEDELMLEFGEEEWAALKNANGRDVEVLKEVTDNYYAIKLPCGTEIENITDYVLEGLD